MRLTLSSQVYFKQSKHCQNLTYARHASSSVLSKQETPTIRDGLSYHWDTTPPTTEQLKRAERFFRASPPKIIDSAIKFRTVKDTDTPEVAFLGRSNVGKSTLLNALMGQNVCHVSSQPGRTKSMNFFAVGGEDHVGNPGRLALLDMPGYGKGSREEWGKEIMKYLIGRKQSGHPILFDGIKALTKHRLRRAFLLVNAQHGLKLTDEEILSQFRQHGIAHQVILSKVDRILSSKKRITVEHVEKNIHALDAICADMRAKIQPGKADGPEALGELVCCSGETILEGQRLGIDKLRWAVLAATGLGDIRRKILPSQIASEMPAQVNAKGEDSLSTL